MSEWGRCTSHFICDCQREKLKAALAENEKMRGQIEECKSHAVFMARQVAELKRALALATRDVS